MNALCSSFSKTVVISAVAIVVAMQATAAAPPQGADDAKGREGGTQSLSGGPTEYARPIDPVLQAMRDLESVSDAKCHSTACRLENFMYGSPLTSEARDAKVALQKRLILKLWREASEGARNNGEESIRVARIKPSLDAVLRVEQIPAGDVRVFLADGSPIILSAVRLRQYSSIAYALRAILGVQQDALLSSGPSLVTLDSDSVAAIKRLVDVVTLVGLKLADEAARERNEHEVSAEAMEGAWHRMLPALSIRPKDGESDAAPAAAQTRHERLAILEGLIDEKIAVYETYNKIGPSKTWQLFVANAQAFYARYPMPRTQEDTTRLVGTFNGLLVEFARQVWVESQRLALMAGRTLIRASDAERAIQLLMPHEIDEFEDVHLFSRLENSERISLESYDCDSFRDLGTHWYVLRHAMLGMDASTMLLDPFGVEIVVEGISGYGVLLLRRAGSIAKAARVDNRLRPADLDQAQLDLANLARKHHSAPPRPAAKADLASTKGTDTAAASDKFFTDITAEAGVKYLHQSSKWLSEFRRSQTAGPPTFSGGGVAAEDLNGDGYPDLLFVGGIGNALLVNDGSGHFRDVTKQAGLTFRRPDGTAGEARTPIIADLDNDGLFDILITYANDAHRLYRGLGSLQFEDVSKQCGLGGVGLIGGPATVFDFDGDGLLDIYIGYFGDYLSGEVPRHARDNRNALPNQLFRNVGKMRFENATKGSGTDDTGWTQATSHTDFDRDGRQDIVVADDFGRNALLRNLGGGRFENIADKLGMTKALHSMNVGVADLNDDGFPEIYVSNIATMVKDNMYVLPNESTPLKFDYDALGTMLVQESNMLYMSEASDGKLNRYREFDKIDRGPTTTGWAWDADFFDFDNDGDDDLYVVNGANEYLNYHSMVALKSSKDKPIHYLFDHDKESNVFFVNDGGRLNNRSGQSGADFVGNSRSAAYFDFDSDGDLDIAVNNFHAPATLLRNNSQARGNNWINIRLIGDPARKCNRDAIGARILATTKAGLRIHREIRSGSGYLSSHPKQQHLGVGPATEVDVTITWPSGDKQMLTGIRVNQTITVRQGAAWKATAGS